VLPNSTTFAFDGVKAFDDAEFNCGSDSYDSTSGVHTYDLSAVYDAVSFGREK
jgi:hypothetical protein